MTNPFIKLIDFVYHGLVATYWMNFPSSSQLYNFESIAAEGSNVIRFDCVIMVLSSIAKIRFLVVFFLCIKVGISSSEEKVFVDTWLWK